MVEITLLGGLVGGLIATVVMTVFMMTLGDDSPPPTALFWSKYVGNEGPESYMMQGMVLHMLYGVGAGVVLAALLPVAGFGDVALVTALGAGLGYGVVLFIGAAGFWMNVVLALDPEPKDVGLFLFFHLVYGAVLGGVLGAGVV
ncbi:hypothetical protein [Halorhabdus rudnickae]|uniref:hypothetical protein n=1 Tax=Halorhabdus rudnickae TaxID=1775544 RepID=UPI001083680B|nr:hypothetical protein [Halorhabdus rudnickae]